MDDKNIQQARLPDVSQKEGKKEDKEEIQSQFYSLYKKIVGPDIVSLHEDHHPYIDLLQQMGIFHPHSKFCLNFQLKIVETSFNFELVILQARWGHIVQPIVILNQAKPSKIHKEEEDESHGNGRYCDIYMGTLIKSKMAVKCYSFRNRAEGKVIFMAIREIFLMKIAHLVGFGPHLHSELGYDLIIYETCVEIFMEECLRPTKDMSSSLYASIDDLNQSLHMMHRLGIFHFDIKPDNILYSPTRKKWIFIDYNLSSLKKVAYGNKIKVDFRGTLNYCYSEMFDLFRRKGERDYIDLFYNDAFSLNLSVNDIKHWGKFHFISQFQEDNNFQTYVQPIKFDNEKPVSLDFLLAESIKVLFFNKSWDMISKVEKEYNLFSNATFFMDIIQFLDEVEPTYQLKQFYNTKIDSSLKQGCELGYYNRLLDFNNYFSIYQVSFNEQKKEVLEKRIRRVLYEEEESSFEDLMKVNVIEGILKTNPDKIDLLTYSRLYLQFVSYTYNRYKIDKAKRVLISDHYLKEFQKYPSLSYLTSTINSQLSEENSIIKAFYHILLLCHRKSLDLPSENLTPSDQITKQLIKKLYFSLIPELFILQTQNLPFWLQNLQILFKNSIFDFQQKLIIFFKVKQNKLWTESRLSLKKNMLRSQFSLSLIYKLDSWFKILLKEVPEAFRGIFEAMKSVSVEKWKKMLENRNEAWRSELCFELKCEYIQRLFEVSKHNTSENLLSQIYLETGLQNRRRIYPILLKFSHYFLTHQSLKRYSNLMFKISTNINQKELMNPLRTYQNYLCKKMTEPKQSIHIRCMLRKFHHLNDWDLLFHVDDIENTVQELILLDHAQLGCKKVTYIQEMIQQTKTLQFIFMRFAQFYLQLVFNQNYSVNHIPITFYCLSICIKITILSMKQIKVFAHEYLQRLYQFIDFMDCVQCMRQIQLFAYYFEEMMIIMFEGEKKEAQFMKCHHSMNILKANMQEQCQQWDYHRCFVTKTSFFYTNYNLFILCDMNPEMQKKHKGCFKYFQLLKEERYFDKYFQQKGDSFPQILSTMITLKRHYKTVFFDFLLCLSDYMKNNSSMQIFVKIKHCFLGFCANLGFSFEQLGQILMDYANANCISKELSIFYCFIYDPNVEETAKRKFSIEISKNICYFQSQLAQIAEGILYHVYIYDHRFENTRKMSRKIRVLMKKIVKLNIRVGNKDFDKIKKKKGMSMFKSLLLRKVDKINYISEYMGMKIQYLSQI